MRVLAAMSGGVDSAVAAARLVAAGHDVTGVHLALSRTPLAYREGSRGCCSLEDSFDARRAADRIGIPFYVWDFSERFAEEVIHPFIDEYRAGRTPNPCLRCNERIKFAAVLERGLDLGFDAVATGHYARLETREGITRMRRAVDPGKDQSYVLGVLNQEQLSHCLFPLGDSYKTEVRAEAARLGLTVADKPDSYDICFIPDGDTAGWLSDQLGEHTGEFRDETGDVVGHHDGYHHFTIGQRRGLHLGTPASDGRPRYVLDIEPVSNTVVVGPSEDLEVHRLEAIRPVWCSDTPGTDSWVGQVQVRAHGTPVEARVQRVDGGVRMTLRTPLKGVAPGQAAVLYDGDLVVGSATICGTDRAGTDIVGATR
ncbi:tRNA 2-thiouridine(34) synthase MnmA [Acidipropionibacterium jensenii]|uniref:tRNA-specific 2-thiouridylase MnmA n=2 Tax=Acidipropionibacterium jensenii TaxID=1749 RepID=A0A448NWD2_9ACTN|nr:tRNA 2-thiouridine(34) synthase MnmA [Acidipropionibacterium jensenii]QCV88962.1 tRNA 2-thiouridine(34) synthase MnmA [Acidipropionibacterium jensenii]VEI02198.1 tRNA-specific 2-thiouridylase mnmA [Acidipropionibacterium jensenii]